MTHQDPYTLRNNEGKCARGCCQTLMAVDGTWYNHGSYAEYCTNCSILINDANNTNLCVRKLFGTSEYEQELKIRENTDGTPIRNPAN